MCSRCSPRTRGALTPTLTLNAGVRWDVQMPFAPSNDTMTTASLADICGVSGIGSGGIYDACNFYAPGSSGGKMPEFSQLTSGTRGYNIDWNNLAPNLGVAWRPSVQERLAARAARRSRAGDAARRLLGSVRAARHRRLHRHLRAQSRQHAEPDAQRHHRHRRSRRKLAGAAARHQNGFTPRHFRKRRRSPFRSGPNRADNINAFHPDIQVASARSWTVGLQRALTSDMAFEMRYVGTTRRQPVVDAQLQRAQRDRERVPRRVQARDDEPARQQRRRRQPQRIVRVFRTGQRHQPTADLSRLPEWPQGRRQCGGLHRWRGDLDERDAGAVGSCLPIRIRTSSAATTVTASAATIANANAAGDLDNNLTFRNNALAAGLPANFFVVNPHADHGERPRQRRVQHLSRAAARAAPPAVTRLGVERQLSVRARRGVGIPRLPFRPRVDAEQLEYSACDQDPVGLGDPGRRAISGTAAPGPRR